MLYALGDLIEPTHGRAIGVSEAHVFSVGEELLHRLGVSSQEFPLSSIISLDQFVSIIYSGHNHSFHPRSSLRSFPTGLYRAFARKQETGHHASFVRVGSRSHHWLCLVPHRVPRSSMGRASRPLPILAVLCHKDNYSNSPITVHPLDGR